MKSKIIAIGFLFMLCLSVQAQFKNIKVEDGGDGRSGGPSIVINPDNPNNIVIASSGGRISYSMDGGVTWANTTLTSSLGVYGNPVLGSNEKGTFYCLNLSDPTGEGIKNEKSLDQIICHISRDGGKTWTEAMPLGLNASKDQVKPSATMDAKGNLQVAWVQFDKYNSADEGCQSTILISSISSGKKWSKPSVLTQSPGACVDGDKAMGVPVPAVAEDNKFYVAWMTQNKIFLDRSFDGGEMWLFNDIPIGDCVGAADLKIPGFAHVNEIPNLLVDRSKGTYKGVLYLSWTDKRNGADDANVWFSRSYTYGDQWSTPTKMGNDETGKHQFHARMAIDQTTGFVYIVYYSRAGYEDNQTDVYLSYTDDSGANFKTVKISETPFIADDNSTFGDYLSISASKGIIMPVWTRTDDGKTSLWSAVIKQTDLITPAAEPSKGKKKK